MNRKEKRARAEARRKRFAFIFFDATQSFLDKMEAENNIIDQVRFERFLNNMVKKLSAKKPQIKNLVLDGLIKARENCMKYFSGWKKAMYKKRGIGKVVA